MRLITANANGVRAALRRGGLAWLDQQQPDVVTLQEVRASDEQLREALDAADLGHLHVSHHPSDQPGRAGVAVLSAKPHESSAVDLGFAGRWIEAEIDGITVVSVYVPKGDTDGPKQEFKYRFLDAMTDRMGQLSSAIITGDLNIAHRDSDLKNWKGNQGKTGCLPQERAYLDRWEDAGWVDVGLGAGYTWWTWRGQAFDNDAGWRIDYAWATPDIADRVTGAWVGRAPSYAERWSDHAAVVVDIAD